MSAGDQSSAAGLPGGPGLPSIPGSTLLGGGDGQGGSPGPATAASRAQRVSRSRSRSRSASKSPSPSAYATESDQVEEDYERQRRALMRQNASLLAELNLAPASTTLSGSPLAPPPKRRGRPPKNPLQRDRHGYIVSLPPPGKKHTLAAVEIRTDRAVRRAIDAGLYVDCTAWEEGEERRWRFGDGNGGELAEGEEELVGGVGKDFRWKTIEEVFHNEESSEEEEAGAEAPPSPKKYAKYADLPEGTCHQCRRRTDKPKMQCRNVNPECRNYFCESCCKRYNYFEFELDARSWLCPVCMECCNCKAHLSKRNLGHLADEVGKGLGQSGSELRPGETVQQYLERIGAKSTYPAFDRVRLVNKKEDIVAPPLTATWVEYLEEQRCNALGITFKKKKKPGPKAKPTPPNADQAEGGKGKGKGKAGKDKVGEGDAQISAEGGEGEGGGKGKGGKGKRKSRANKSKGDDSAPNEEDAIRAVLAASGLGAADGSGQEGTKKKRGKKRAVDGEARPRKGKAAKLAHVGGNRGTETPPILLRTSAVPRVHEVDSDGDSVRGYSSDDAASRSPSPPQDVGAASTQQQQQQETTNDFLARMALAVVANLPTLDDQLWPQINNIDQIEMDAHQLSGLDGPLEPIEGEVQMEPLPSLPSLSSLNMGSGSMGGGAMGSGLNATERPPSSLRLTLAPAAPPGLEALEGQTGQSPRTPRRPRGNSHVRFNVPELSPPNTDLPSLYPTFPELGYLPFGNSPGNGSNSHSHSQAQAHGHAQQTQQAQGSGGGGAGGGGGTYSPRTYSPFGFASTADARNGGALERYAARAETERDGTRGGFWQQRDGNGNGHEQGRAHANTQHSQEHVRSHQQEREWQFTQQSQQQAYSQQQYQQPQAHSQSHSQPQTHQQGQQSQDQQWRNAYEQEQEVQRRHSQRGQTIYDQRQEVQQRTLYSPPGFDQHTQHHSYDHSQGSHHSQLSHHSQQSQQSHHSQQTPYAQPSYHSQPLPQHSQPPQEHYSQPHQQHQQYQHQLPDRQYGQQPPPHVAHAQTQPQPPSPDAHHRRRPPPAAYIVRAPKSVQGQIENARLYQRA